MATKPIPFGSDGTYGTELNEYLDVSLAADGKIKTEALQTDSTAPVLDAALANKKYVDDGGERLVDGVATMIYTKYLTGNLDADDKTEIAHGIASGKTKIISLVFMVRDGLQERNVVGDIKIGPASSLSCQASIDDTYVIIDDVGAYLQGEGYKLRIEYIA